MPTDALGGELQTLISTLQNGNVQLGNIVQRLDKLYSLGPGRSAQIFGGIASHVGGSGSAGRLPDAPDGYITVDIPGVGPRLVPFYPA
jgi:hypothetical protein